MSELTTVERLVLEQAAELAARVAAESYLLCVDVTASPSEALELARLFRGRRYGHDLPSFSDTVPPLDMSHEADGIAAAADAGRWRACFERATWFGMGALCILDGYAVPTPFEWAWAENSDSENNDNGPTNGQENQS